MQSEPSLEDSISIQPFERDDVAAFMRAAELYHTLFGKPQLFCINKTFFTKVIGWFVQNRQYPLYSDDDMPKIVMFGVEFDSSDLNPPKYLIGIHRDASVKRVTI